MTLILSDIDNTLLDIDTPFSAWLTARRGITPLGPLTYSKSAKDFLGEGGSKRAIDLLLQNWADDGEAFGNLPAFNDAANVIPELADAGCRLVAISACINSAGVHAKRRRNLKRAFGRDFAAVHCLGLDVAKTNVLSAYAPAVFVEDNPYQAAHGVALGHKCFLLDRTYNRGVDTPGVHRVASWYDILDILDDASIFGDRR